jgi:anaerobic selenocysteine-containing dehydrogenase
MTTDIHTHYRACNLCEAICGLEIKYRDNEVISINGDKNDPFSRGHICPKALALKDIYEDPNRLKFPIKRTPNGWVQIGWTEALDEVSTRLKDIQKRHGNNAVAMYAGNPSVHNSGVFLSGTGLMKALKTKNIYSATSTDQLPHHFASWQMFGHPFLLPIPDIDHTDYWLIMGGNPIASNGSIMTAPDVANRLKAIQERGGKVVVIDPRFTETAAKANAHHFITPGTDAFLLLAMLQVVFEEKLDKTPSYVVDLEELKTIVKNYTPERVAKQTGISAVAIRQIVRDFTAAKAAVAYGRVGLSVQAFGGVCQWLLNVFNVVTGNIDTPGGAMFTQPAFDILLHSKAPYERHNRFQSRVRGLAEFMGELPVSCLAEEIMTEGPDQVRALITSCGNPILSTPNGRQLDVAFEQLEFMVSIDIYLNESSRHAHIILPTATGLEVSHYDLTFNALAIRNVTRFSEPLFPKAEGAKFDWEVFQELTARMTNDYDSDITPIPQDPHQKVLMGVAIGPHKISPETLKNSPHGIDLGPLQPCLKERLLTSDKKIHLAPTLLVGDMARVEKALNATTTDTTFDLLLINRRHLRDNNSWLHNSARLVKGRNRCTLLMHPADAQKRNITDTATVKVRSRVGEVVVPVEISDKMMVGVVCMPHGYGHDRKGIKMDIAQAHAGVNVNDLSDEMRLDDLTGNAVFGGIPVAVLG